MKPKVLAAMSGGVDSSVAALLLRDAGYDVTGVTMCLGIADDGDRSRCCGRDAVDDARRVCGRLKIPHHVIDFAKAMQEEVIDRFVQGYMLGRTPNPCIDCNRHLKFGRLLDMARSMGFAFLATGHYARIAQDDDGFRLMKPADRTKDQTYFLYPIGRNDLAAILFPLADLTKEEVRSIAKNEGLPVAGKADSQDVCFIPRKGYRRFIQDRAGPADSGWIVDTMGRERGRHDGIHAFTVGQRSGLGISAPNPLYVVSVDPEGNRIVIGEKKDLLASRLRAVDLNMLVDCWPETAAAKIRYRRKASNCRIVPTDGGLDIVFDEPQEAITPGQAVVLYQGDRVIGGGIIERVVHGSH